jgi:predicted aspartyl protease
LNSRASLALAGHIALAVLMCPVQSASARTPGGDPAPGQRLQVSGAAGSRDISLPQYSGNSTTGMVEAQKSYDIPKLLTLSLSCRNDSMKRNRLSQALFCNTVAYRAALILADAHQVFSTLSWAKQTGFPAKERAGGGPSVFGNAFDRTDVVQLAKSVPPIEEHLAPGRVTIPYTNASNVTSTGSAGGVSRRADNLLAVPMVTVSIDQKETEAIADTGLSYSIVMDQLHADALGVTTLVEGLPPLGTLGRDPVGVDQRLGLARELTLGPLTLHNVMIVVIPSGNPATDRVVVGLPLLARLKRFSYEESGIVVGEASRECSAPIELSFVSSWNEDGKVVFDARADGKTVKASIDTGAAPPLVAGNQLQPPGDAQMGGATALDERRYLKVDVGGRTLRYDDTPIVPSLVFPAFLVGAPIMATSDIQFDFNKPSLCIVPRSHMGS